MRRTLVDEKRWIGEQRFLHALSYCMLPGVVALFLGLAPAVLAIVTQAVTRTAGRALRHPALYFATHTLFTITRLLEWGPLRLVRPVWSSYAWEAWGVGIGLLP